MKNDLKPFTDVRVRRAVLKALDKEQLVQFALFGQGASTSRPISPNRAFFDASLPVHLGSPRGRSRRGSGQ